MAFQPTDEQARAIAHLDGPLCITAGAGSGKTRVLAERLAAAADPSRERPVEMDEALVVTFTEKAAGELAERVRRVLLEQGRVSQARRVDEAWISTIHGMCRRLLRMHALEAGIDPSFAVLSAAEAATLKDEVFEQVLRERLEAGPADRLVPVYGVATVRDMALEVFERLRAMGATADDVSTEAPVSAHEALEAARAALGDWVRRLSACPAPTATLSAVTASVADAAETLHGLAGSASLPAADLADELLAVLSRVRLSRSVGKAAKDLVIDIDAERLALLDLAVRAVAVPLAESLVEAVRAFDEAYAETKRQRGVLDFDDLQLHALRLLEGAAGAETSYSGAFRLVMIDEFQDTNEVQTALTDLLAAGRLCTVGDERQSIYSFRFADVDIYRRHTEAMLKAGAATAELAVNFRSHPEVLDFVNRLFSHARLFGPAFLALRHGRDETGAAAWPPKVPRVDLALVARDGRDGQRARAVEADAVARRLRTLADAGVAQGDMVVLMRAMTHAERYAEALRAHGLEAVVLSGGAFFDRPEVEAVLAFLRAASNPLDDRALAHVLASELAGLSDDGLIALRRQAERGPLWRVLGSTALDPEDATVVGRVSEALDRARTREGRLGVSGIIHHAIEELDLDLRLLGAGEAGRRAYANVLKLARLADEYEGAGGSGMSGFADHIELERRSERRETPADLADDRVDAVRIMTVHAAKGLEFPVVALPELGRDLPAGRDRFVLEKGSPGPILSLGLPAGSGPGRAVERRSAWMSEARDRARALESEEEVRLLYVACTRAREALILSGTTGTGDSAGDRPIDRIRAALGLASDAVATGIPLGDGARVRVERLDGGEEPPPPTCTPRAPRAAAPSAPLPSVAATGAPENGSSAPPVVSYSALALYRACHLRYHATSITRLGRATSAEPGDPRRFGDAVHAALRLVGPGGEAPAAERLDAIARWHGLGPDEIARLRSAVHRHVRSELSRSLHAGDPPGREVAFAVPLGVATLAGRLDVLVRRGDRAVVVDYKTGPGALADTSADAHREQADCYALAMLSDGAQALDVIFVGVETVGDYGEPLSLTHSYHAADLDGLRERLTVRAEELVSGPYEPLASYRPGACDECPAANSICPVRVPARSRR